MDSSDRVYRRYYCCQCCQSSSSSPNVQLLCTIIKHTVMSNKLCFSVCSIAIVLILCLTFVFAIDNNETNYNNDIFRGQIVKLPDLGLIQGSITKTAWTQQTIYQFLGIPFAESPKNQLRFKPPIPRKPWSTNILSAVRHRRPCPNIHLLSKLNSTELEDDLEDCLNIAVYTKHIKSQNPVMVYIHGGAFNNGSAADHPPNYLLEQEIVLVVPEYRLGALGFLSTKSDQIPGNVAVMDLVLALQWVQKYIKYFGGDSNKVTIFGQSAGAALLNVLMYSPAVPTGLFRSVINQSGSFLAKWAYIENPIVSARNVCKKLDCGFCNEVVEINKCLMEASVVKLIQAIPGQEEDGFYGLTVGDKNNILPNTPLALMKESRKRYPMIGGITKHDGIFLLASVYDALKWKFGNLSVLSSQDIVDTVIWACKEEEEDSGVINSLTKKLLFTYDQLNQRNFTNLIPGLVDLSSILIMKAPVLRLIQLHAKLNPSSTYLYTFDYKGQYTRFGYEKGNEHYPFNGGIHHSDDNIYIFPKFELNDNETRFAKNMIELWTSFAITGIPRTSDFTKWETINEGTGPYLHIDEDFSIGKDFLDEYLITVNDPDNNIIRKP